VYADCEEIISLCQLYEELFDDKEEKLMNTLNEKIYNLLTEYKFPDTKKDKKTTFDLPIF
jgi:hypothetical protein